MTNRRSIAAERPCGSQDLGRHLRRFWVEEDGTSALEVALIAPVLVFGLIGMADVGLAVNERMIIDQALRAGAQSAMEDSGPEAVERVLRATAEMNFTLAAPSSPATSAELALGVTRFCACRAAPDTAVNCSTTCTAQSPTQIYYRLTAAKIHDNLLLPATRIAAQLLIESR